jgi:hypothetical protein
MFTIIHIGETIVRLDNTSHPPIVVLSFPRTNYPRTTTTMQHLFSSECHMLHQPYLHCLHGIKYNTLLYNDIVMVNERHCHPTEDHQLQPYVPDSSPDNLEPQPHVPLVLTTT